LIEKEIFLLIELIFRILTGNQPGEKVLKRKCLMKKLNQLQRLFLIKVSKSYKTISYNKLYVISGYLPLDIKLKQIIDIYNIKSKNQLCLPDNKIQIKKPIKWYNKSNYKQRERIVLTELNDQKEIDFYEDGKTLAIYTDASKNDSIVGCSVVIYKNNKIKLMENYQLSVHCSVYQGELAAIDKAFDFN
jgi:hypothetical protein